MLLPCFGYGVKSSGWISVIGDSEEGGSAGASHSVVLCVAVFINDSDEEGSVSATHSVVFFLYDIL